RPEAPGRPSIIRIVSETDVSLVQRLARRQTHQGHQHVKEKELDPCALVQLDIHSVEEGVARKMLSISSREGQSVNRILSAVRSPGSLRPSLSTSLIHHQKPN